MYAMDALGYIHYAGKEYEQAMAWFTKCAEAGLPKGMLKLGICLDSGEGVAAPDYVAAADWYIRAVDAGDGRAALKLSDMYTLGRGRAWQIMPAASSSIV